MNKLQKLEILADAAKYDASCASSGTTRKDSSSGKGVGSTGGAGICHSYTPDGRCISLLKVLLTNVCLYDCHYCINRRSSNVRRARFTPEGVVDLTLSFYKRNYIEGLFLSSGIVRSADYTMELVIKVAKSLREEHHFRGYIHLKTIPEASHAVEKTQVVQSQQQKSIQSLQLAVADVKGRRPNDWLLAEADYLVKLAGRKLFLEHDAVSATKLMESADQRIAALNDPSLVSLRQSMTNDITKLRTIPLIDRDGLVLRITSLQQQVDHLPLANAILPEAAVVEKKAVSGDINDWQNNLMTSMKDFSENFITFRSRDGEVIPLLSPEQHFYLRENIKGKLETAIRAVYKEQGDVYNAALKTANEWSTAYLNQDNQSVIEFEKAIKQLSEQNISVKYPVKLESQNELSDVIRERLRREMTVMTTEEK